MSLATKKSLVLGDEICHGTESSSGIAIVAASIEEMVRLNTNFMFATHLHDLSNMEDITTLKTVEFKHFHVETKIKNGETEIIYNRKLMDGSGLASYGIEVAAAQGIPDRVIKEAHRLRRKMHGEAMTIIDTRTSHFNAATVLDRCGVPGCGERADETHHIRFQSEADENGFIDERFHKNSGFNLVGLCKPHHDDQTFGRTYITGWAFGLDGKRRLMIEKVKEKKKEQPEKKKEQQEKMEKIEKIEKPKGLPIQLKPPVSVSEVDKVKTPKSATLSTYWGKTKK